MHPNLKGRDFIAEYIAACHLWGTNPAVKEYGNRYSPTEFMIIAAPPASAPQ